MFVAYLTHDEVNAEAARVVAARIGLGLRVIGLRHKVEAAAADRLVVDLDALPADWRADLFARVAVGQTFPWVSVHSYRLTRDEARTLRAAGLTVTRALDPHLFLPVINLTGSTF
jgi:hypothetical protein